MRFVRRNRKTVFPDAGAFVLCAVAGLIFSGGCGASTARGALASTAPRLAGKFAAQPLGATPWRTPTPTPTQTQAQPPTQTSAQSALTQSLGTVKAINGNVLTLTLDSGTDVTVNVTDTTKIVQVAPGQKNLKTAAAIHISDLQVGDRILVRSRASDDPKAITALGIIAMKRGDVDAKKTQDRDDWQKRGVGGLVKAVDPAAGTITISAPAVAGVSKTTVIHTTNATVLRRYAPDSVKFDDAKAAPIEQIKPGDQLRARGEKSGDGDEFAAAEVVSGTFRNIAGTITGVDAAAKTINVSDLISKKAMMVKISDESQLKKLSPEMALRIAMRFRGGGTDAAGGGSGATGNGGAGSSSNSASGAGSRPATPDANTGGGPGGGGMQRAGEAGAGGGRPDFQQVVNRLPAVALTEFQKGDVVLVVSTQGTDAGGVTAITVLGGVEAILAAVPGGASQAMTLSPWSLGGAPGGDAGGGVQ
jgi:hypothetical protein